MINDIKVHIYSLDSSDTPVMPADFGMMFLAVVSICTVAGVMFEAVCQIAGF